MRRQTQLQLIAPAAAALLLAGLAVEVFSRPRPAQAAPYHKKVREAIDALPSQFGDWVSKKVPAAQEAVELLNPNRIYNRRFYNTQTGQVVTVLLVHCKDARDIYGHYPPICYPANGREQRSARPIERNVDGVEIPGMEYVFSAQEVGGNNMIVDNFIIRPNGRLDRDMDAVKKQAWDYTNRFYGAAQMQVVFTGGKASKEERRRIFRQMVEAHMPAIEAIRYGANRDE